MAASAWCRPIATTPLQSEAQRFSTLRVRFPDIAYMLELLLNARYFEVLIKKVECGAIFRAAISATTSATISENNSETIRAKCVPDSAPN